MEIVTHKVCHWVIKWQNILNAVDLPETLKKALLHVQPSEPQPIHNLLFANIRIIFKVKLYHRSIT